MWFVFRSLHDLNVYYISGRLKDQEKLKTPHATLPQISAIVCMFQGPGSFLASPIRDSPGPTGGLPPLGSHRPARPMQGPLGPMYHPPIGMAGPHGLPAPNVPPLGLPLPANGHPGMPLPGPMGGDFGLRPANGHAFRPRAGPDPRGPPPPHFRPPPPHHFGPMPPPHSM